MTKQDTNIEEAILDVKDSIANLANRIEISSHDTAAMVVDTLSHRFELIHERLDHIEKVLTKPILTINSK